MSEVVWFVVLTGLASLVVPAVRIRAIRKDRKALEAGRGNRGGKSG